MRPDLHPEAETEFEAAGDYFEREARPGIAVRFVRAVRDTIALAERYPTRHAHFEDTRARIASVPEFKYGVVYTETDDTIFVIAVAHLHRRPEYWKHRLAD